MHEALDTIINGTYFIFGGTLYHQNKGIPMGINCAVHMADQYLWTYEYDFLLQLVSIVGSATGISNAAVRKGKDAIH